jgi:hypothetical protein
MRAYLKNGETTITEIKVSCPFKVLKYDNQYYFLDGINIQGSDGRLCFYQQTEVAEFESIGMRVNAK